MKNRKVARALSIALLLSLLCACGQQPQQPKTDSTDSVQSPDSTQSPDTDHEESMILLPESKEVSISELYSEDGVCIDLGGAEMKYSYHVPQIEDDTPDAALINEEIATLYGEIVKISLEGVKNNGVPGCNIITYESYRSGDILSLVIKCAYYYEYFEEFGTYNYDTAKGVRLTNEDILAMKDVTQEQYLYAVRCAAVKCYDDQYFPIWEDFGGISLQGAYQERRSWTLSIKNITLDLPLYLDSDGVIHTIAAIGCHAGADRLYQTLTPDLEEDTADVETEEYLDFLTVTRRDRELTIRFNQTQLCAEILEACDYMDDVPYGRELPVHGLYGDYAGIFCDTIGELGAPYIFLLTKEGRVEYIDVLACLRGEYFCAGGPLLGVDDVKDFTAASDDDGSQSIYALTGNGEKVELDQFIATDQHNMDISFTGDWGFSRTVSMDGGSSYEEFFSLTLSDCDNVVLTCYQPDLDTKMESVGHLIYLGMTEKGTVYAYRTWSIYSNGPGVEGVIALDVEYDYRAAVPTCTLTITELGGTPFIGEQTGETTVFVKSFG